MKTILLVIAFAVCGWGQNPSAAPTSTKGFYNGRFWKSLDVSSKLMFLAGYNNGATLASTFAAADFASFQRVTKQVLPSTLSGYEVSAALDRFYDTPENAPIAIAWALTVISDKASGADDASIQKSIERLRADTLVPR